FTRKILFTTDSYIKEFDVESNTVTILADHADRVYGMDYDDKHNYIYFTRHFNYDVMRLRYPSQNYTLQSICTTGINPGGIAIDYVLGHVYFAHDNTKISRCNLDGSNAVDIHTSLNGPFALGLDVKNGWMYFSENGIPRKMARSRFDLSQRQDIYTQPFVAYSLDLDLDEDILYWIIDESNEIKSANFDGSNIKTVMNINAHGGKYDNPPIRISESYIFFTELGKLFRMNKTTATSPSLLFTDTQRINSLYLYEHTGKKSH
ncbi:Hypothetical predicted protein, partial [Mytilus galloprovincialis]